MKKYIVKYLEEVLIEIKSKLSDENKIDIDDIKKILLKIVNKTYIGGN